MKSNVRQKILNNLKINILIDAEQSNQNHLNSFSELNGFRLSLVTTYNLTNQALEKIFCQVQKYAG